MSSRPPFDDKTMIEILKDRDRLWQYKQKVERYQDDEMFTNEESKSTPLPPETSPEQRLNKLEGNLISLRDILKQHVNETRPIKKVPKGSVGIEE